MDRCNLFTTKLFAALIAAGLVCGSAMAQQPDFSKVEIKAEKLADNLYMLMGAGGNMGLLVGADGAVLVDDQFAPLTPKILAAIGKITDRPVRFVINTHFHFDHTGGNENFAKAGSTIIAHDNTLKRLPNRWVNKAFGFDIPAAPPAALPVLTFPQALSLHLNGEDLDAMHLPNAHTDSDVALYFRKANVVHMGDVFPGTVYPFIDNEAGGSLDGVIAAVAKILQHTNATTRYIPGHAPLATRAQLQEYHDMLSTVRNRISDAISKGKTQEECLASQPTKEFDAKFGAGMVKADLWVQRAYVDLRRAASKS